ncbi:MarR family transcriptional regulator [Pusillimonas sp. T2]|uniref:MarR family winged helix-turn-helix transcriptional regulator n=1 Tax=Pusillimonas sp. T2 TaxID=1548123 RepID=UPI000B9C8DD5|nr:MarR family transcriptional regulator [Pusillimonas sp. T2]OXR48191.1 MarR family transcriptional regulator [Pusillimonas sp. T2]
MTAKATSRQPAPVDQSYLLGLLGYNCLQAYLKIIPQVKKQLKKVHLRPVEFTVLAVIVDNPDINQKRLGEAINVSPPNLATLLDRMQADGLLTRQRNPNDKRSQILALTLQGQQRYEKARAGIADLDRPASLSSDEHDQLIYLLQKVFL